jgi:hypothetical protein
MKIPIVRQILWPAIVLQILILGVLVWIASIKSSDYGFPIGALCYLGLSITLRRTISRDHRSGIRKMRREQFRDAIHAFERSVAFFERHPWIDSFRWITLLSASSMTYREMGLVNIAFAYSQHGNGEKSRAYYEMCIKEFPGNGIALSALRLMDSVNKPLQSD